VSIFSKVRKFFGGRDRGGPASKDGAAPKRPDGWLGSFPSPSGVAPPRPGDPPKRRPGQAKFPWQLELNGLTLRFNPIEGTVRATVTAGHGAVISTRGDRDGDILLWLGDPVTSDVKEAILASPDDPDWFDPSVANPQDFGTKWWVGDNYEGVGSADPTALANLVLNTGLGIHGSPTRKRAVGTFVDRVAGVSQVRGMGGKFSADEWGAWRTNDLKSPIQFSPWSTELFKQLVNAKRQRGDDLQPEMKDGEDK